MTRTVFGILGVLAGLWALQPIGPALAQTDTAAAPDAAPATFADGVRSILSLDYAGMSRDALSRETSWPLAFIDSAWAYKGKIDKGDDYLYGGSDAGGKFSITYGDIHLQGEHHFSVQMLTTRAPLPEGAGCLLLRDLRVDAAHANWSEILNYQSMLAHGFTARKGRLTLNVRVDTGIGPNAPMNPTLDAEGCVNAVVIKDALPETAG